MIPWPTWQQRCWRRRPNISRSSDCRWAATSPRRSCDRRRTGSFASPCSTPRRAQRRGLIELAGKGHFKGVTPRLLPQLLSPDRLTDQALVDTIIGMAERIGRDAFLRQQAAIMGRPDGRTDLGRIACPTLVLCGRQDALAPPAVHQEMAAAIPGAELVVVEDCGHLSTLEQPDIVSD